MKKLWWYITAGLALLVALLFGIIRLLRPKGSKKALQEVLHEEREAQREKIKIREQGEAAQQRIKQRYQQQKKQIKKKLNAELALVKKEGANKTEEELASEFDKEAEEFERELDGKLGA